jgi:hypothetical protein
VAWTIARDQDHQEAFAVGIAHIADWIFKYFRKAPISIGAFLFGLLTVFDDGLAARTVFVFFLDHRRTLGRLTLLDDGGTVPIPLAVVIAVSATFCAEN